MFQLFLRVGEAPGTGLVVRRVGIDSNGSAAGAFEDRTLNLELAIRLHFSDYKVRLRVSRAACRCMV